MGNQQNAGSEGATMSSLGGNGTAAGGKGGGGTPQKTFKQKLRAPPNAVGELFQTSDRSLASNASNNSGGGGGGIMRRLSWRGGGGGGGGRRNSNLSGASGTSQGALTEDPSFQGRIRTPSITEALRGHKRTSSESNILTAQQNAGTLKKNEGGKTAAGTRGGNVSGGGNQPAGAGGDASLRRPAELTLSSLPPPRSASSAPDSATLSPRLDMTAITGGSGVPGASSSTLNASALTISTIMGQGNNSTILNGADTSSALLDEELLESLTMESDAAALGVTNLLSVRQTARHEKEIKEATKIKPWLYLGGDEVAKSKKLLREMHITHVLNAAHAVCENYHEEDEDFEYVRPMDLADEASESIGHFLLQAIADIDRVRENGGKILVHCHLGASRSATLVIAYLMWYDKLTCAEALKIVKGLRSVVQPNLGFLLQLKEFETRLAWRPQEPTLHRVAPRSSTDGTLVVKLVVTADGKEQPVRPTPSLLDPRGAFLLHSPADSTMFLWVGPEVGLAAETEAAQRAAARAGANIRRGSSTRVRESYQDAGKRVGTMMCRYEPAYQGCDLVQVPSTEGPETALAPGANEKSYAAMFWRALGVAPGGTGRIESRRPSSRRRWSEEEDLGIVAYINKASTAQFEVTGVNDDNSPGSSVVMGPTATSSGGGNAQGDVSSTTFIESSTKSKTVGKASASSSSTAVSILSNSPFSSSPSTNNPANRKTVTPDTNNTSASPIAGGRAGNREIAVTASKQISSSSSPASS